MVKIDIGGHFVHNLWLFRKKLGLMSKTVRFGCPLKKSPTKTKVDFFCEKIKRKRPQSLLSTILKTIFRC